MNDKEKKLTEALNFGSDVGDVMYVDAEPISYDPPEIAGLEKHIMITTVPHKLTFKEKRKELVDQLDRDMQKISVDLSAKALGNKIQIYDNDIGTNICEFTERVDDICNFRLFDCYLSVVEVIKIMDAIAKFVQESERLRKQYKND